MNSHQRAVARKDHDLKMIGMRARTQIPLLQQEIEKLRTENEALKTEIENLKAHGAFVQE